VKNKETSRDIIINTTINLMLEDSTQNSDQFKPPSFREIANKADLSLGLINYHFKSQDNLIRQAVKLYIDTKIIKPFNPFKKGEFKSLSAIEKLSRVIQGPLDFIYENPKLAKISILNDFTYPAANDNSATTWDGIYMIVKEVTKDSDDQNIRFAVWSIVASIHEAFLRPEYFKQCCGLDLTIQEHRNTLAAYLAKTIFLR